MDSTLDIPTERLIDILESVPDMSEDSQIEITLTLWVGDDDVYSQEIRQRVTMGRDVAIAMISDAAREAQGVINGKDKERSTEVNPGGDVDDPLV